MKNISNHLPKGETERRGSESLLDYINVYPQTHGVTDLPRHRTNGHSASSAVHIPPQDPSTPLEHPAGFTGPDAAKPTPRCRRNSEVQVEGYPRPPIPCASCPFVLQGKLSSRKHVAMDRTHQSQNIYYIIALCEPAVLLASHLPSRASDIVIHVLAHNSDVLASNVRFTSPWLAGCLLLACGSLLRLACYRELGKFFTWELSIKKDQRLVTTGPYSVVRHPSYAASALMGLGTVLMHFAPGGWYAECLGYMSWASKVFAFLWSAWELLLPLALMTRVEKEDSVLREKFGDEWDAWRKQTPYRVFPLVY